MNLFNRKTLLEKLNETSEWDLLIVGGGATGLGIAVDAASRGFKTLLIEQYDFAKGTSSRSTKLVHGGVRYLAQGNIRLVTEALKERSFLLRNAPHVSKNKSFIIPCYSWMTGIYYAAGLKIYDWLSGRKSIGKSELISKKEIEKRLPAINKSSLQCGVLYHDGVFDDARLALNLAQTAIEKGAVVLNYFKLVTLKKNDVQKICGGIIRNEETGEKFEIDAKVVINATGVFADQLLQMDQPLAKSMIRPSQGIHLVLDKSFLQSEDAIMIPKTSDGRVLFVIPWKDKALVGTTDTPLKTPSAEPHALEKEIEFVLKTAGRFLSKIPERKDVLSVFAGLRPLASTENESSQTKEISRSHKVIISDSNLVSVIGGKWTTYRKMAVDTLNKIFASKLLSFKNGSTENLKIHGYSTEDKKGALSVYGSDETAIESLEKENADYEEPLSSETSITVAQVVWAVRNEMARTVEDFLARRTRVLFTDAKLAMNLAPKVAEIMMKELNRDEEWKSRQIAEFKRLAKNYSLNP
ncbi:MAG: FAD-dependent oxidoreductase [Ginsengibacter sp.]